MDYDCACPTCGAPIRRPALGGLCPACVGRGVVQFAARNDSNVGAASGPSLVGDDAIAESGASAELEAGRVIGLYRLLRRIGEGGFGIVYLAEQTSPVKRLVALKVIKPGMDTRQVVARFAAERQALALMNHPGIARVYDAGVTPIGRPYFAMEFVEGIPITHYVRRRRLSLKSRLELFIEVCNAVQHAHQKGVIHRDLKPSNILVTVQGGRPVPKVIDFGLVKSMEIDLTEQTVVTQLHQWLGTPDYMSPEQAEIGAVDVDTRSDVYALGVLLYELLTGRTPFDFRAARRLGLDEVRRQLQAQDPPRPSVRLAALGVAGLVEAARERRVSPERLPRLMRGDLDWMVMKALEKERTRRYETANALAMDVRRHLNFEPVRARPPTAWYRFQRMVCRNKLVVGSAVVVAGVLAIALVVSTASWAQERRARREAIAMAEESRRRVVRLNVATGTRLVEEMDWLAALPWFVEALRLEAGDPGREDVHRRRVAAVLRAAPRLAQIWMHEGLVGQAEFSSDGTRVVSSSLDRTVRTWDAATGHPTAPAFPLAGDAIGAVFSPSGRRVVTVDSEGRLAFWDIQSGRLVGTPFITTAGFVAKSAFTPDGRWLLVPCTNGVEYFDAEEGRPARRRLDAPGLSAQLVKVSADGRTVAAGVSSRDLRIWDVTVIPPAARVLRHGANVRGFAFSHDGQRVATVTLRELSLWNVGSGERVWSPIRPGGDLFDCQFSPDDRALATCSWDGNARVFDAATGFPVGDSMRHLVGVGQAVFSPDGRWLATASWDCTARLWDPRTGQPASPSLRHAGYVMTARFSPDGTRLVTASQDGTARLWELPTNSAARLSLRHPGVSGASFSRDGRWVFSCGGDGTARIWNALSGEEGCRLVHEGRVTSGGFSRGGRRVVTATDRGVAQVWDVAGGRRVGAEARHEKGVRHVEFSGDGRRFLTASDDGTARVWDADTGEPLTPPLRHAGRVRYASFSADGRRVVTAAFEGVAQIWDAETGASIGPGLTNACEVYHAVFSPDGRRVVTAALDRTQLARAAQTWDAATGRADGPPLPHIDGVFYAEFSPDGRLIATCSEDKTALVWDAATGRRLTPPMPHRSYVFEARFSPDSRLLLTVSHDGTARVWDAGTGEPVTPPLSHEGAAVYSGAWSFDGREVLTASASGTVRVWDVSPATGALAELRARAELLSAQRLEADLGVAPLSSAEMKARWQALKH